MIYWEIFRFLILEFNLVMNKLVHIYASTVKRINSSTGIYYHGVTYDFIIENRITFNLDVELSIWLSDSNWYRSQEVNPYTLSPRIDTAFLNLYAKKSFLIMVEGTNWPWILRLLTVINRSKDSSIGLWKFNLNYQLFFRKNCRNTGTIKIWIAISCLHSNNSTIG